MIPLVSAVMPTRGRATMTQRAIDSFQAQDWPNKELIIVDDEDCPSLPGFKAPSNIHYLCMPTRHVIGEKRNIGCSQAMGEFVITFDSDDWSAPTRITDQIGLLQSTGKKVAGYYSAMFYDNRTVKLAENGAWHEASKWWKLEFPHEHAIGSSHCFRRSWWERFPFPDIQIGEDAGFWATAMHGHVTVTTEGTDHLFCLNHLGNVSKRLSGGKGWTNLSESEALSKNVTPRFD